MNASTGKEVMETQWRMEGDIAVLTINNVARRNALSDPVMADIMRHLDVLTGDRNCRAIVITGAGGVFGAGGDVKDMNERNVVNHDYLWRRLFREKGSSSGVIKTLVTCPKPVITAVEGLAFGSSLSMAVAGDYTVAANNTRFAAAQIRRGLCPDGLMYYTMTARCGVGRARELLLSGREFNAIEAEKYGIVHELAEPGKALETAMGAAERYAALPPLAFALAKSAMSSSCSYHTLEAAFRAEQDYQPVVALSNDHKESVAAFLEKRKPVFTGD